MSLLLCVQVLAAVAGLLGTALLAFRSRWSGWGFVAYLVSNFAWAWVAIDQQLWPLFWQQVGFTAFSMVGVAKWLIEPVVGHKLGELWK
jgi:nicotinamide riboside transporter PnuC